MTIFRAYLLLIAFVIVGCGGKKETIEPISSLDKYKVVSAIASNVIGKIGAPSRSPETDDLQLFMDVFNLQMEVHSGASMEQYFRWSSVAEIQRIVRRLEHLKLMEHAQITSKSIDVAFPDGLPDNPERKSELTFWSKKQENELDQLFIQFSKIGGIDDALYKFAQERKILDMERFDGMFY